MAALLYNTISYNWQIVFLRFGHRFPQSVSFAKSRCFRQQFRIVVSVIPITNPYDQIVAICRYAVTNDLTPIKFCTVTHIINIAMSKLCSCWAYLHSNQKAFIPWFYVTCTNLVINLWFCYDQIHKRAFSNN